MKLTPEEIKQLIRWYHIAQDSHPDLIKPEDTHLCARLRYPNGTNPLPRTPFIYTKKPTAVNFSVGPCPYCGRLDHWLNDIPLKAFCWGSEEDPHEEWSALIPAPYNLYLAGYDPTATAEPIEYLDLRPDHLKKTC